MYFSTIETGTFKVKVNINSYNLDTLISNANKLPLQGANKTFTIVASKSHMSTETKDYIQKMRDVHWKVNLIFKGSSLKLCMVAEG